jgi:hypothetical protein
VLRPRRPCAALGRATCRARAAPPPSPSRAVFSPPCHAARLSSRATPRRCSPSLQSNQRYLLLPVDPRVLPRSRTAFPTPRWPTPISPTSHRCRPCRHAHRRRASSCLRAATSSSGPRAPPTAPLALTLAFAHLYFAQFLLLPSPPFTRASPPSLVIVDSHYHHPQTPIQCISSIVTTHRSSQSKPISNSSTRTAGPPRRRAPYSAAARPPVDPPVQGLFTSTKGTNSTTSSP